jgi:rsbT co-antagonist protein RsbR
MTAGAAPGSPDPQMLESIVEALLVLSEVGYGNLDSRVELQGDAGSPVRALMEGINDMIVALADERARSSAYRQELEDKLTTIERQQVAIRELSTPVMEVWDGVLCLPVVGVVDSARSAQMTDVLLQSLAERRAQCAIIDITGIEVMDTRTVDHFARMARTVRLLGATCILTGVSPHIAHTMVHMGIDLSDVTTHRSLRDALRSYVLSKRAA